MAGFLIIGGKLFYVGEVIFTAMYVANTSPYSSLGSETPYSTFFNKNAGMPVLQVICSRALIHTEIYTSKFEGKAWGGILYGYQ